MRKPSDLGQSLWPEEPWRCVVCLEKHLPGKDAISKSMHKTIEYSEGMDEGFDHEAKGLKADGHCNRAEWARMMAVEIKKQAWPAPRTSPKAHGEAVPPPTETFLHDALTIPDLAAVEGSLDRGRLLLQCGTDVVAMALDAAISIQASYSLERMLAHQLAAAHKVAMQQKGQVPV